MKTENWIHGWLKSIWKKKEVPDYRMITDKVKFNKLGAVHKNHPFKTREFDGAFKECDCLPDCGCKEPTSTEEIQIDGC